MNFASSSTWSPCESRAAPEKYKFAPLTVLCSVKNQPEIERLDSAGIIKLVSTNSKIAPDPTVMFPVAT